MNFFEHQDRARTQTVWLLFLFVIAVLGLVIFACIFVAIFFSYNYYRLDKEQQFIEIIKQTPPDLLLQVAVAIFCIVFLASIFRFIQLASGGSRVAESLGGMLLNISSNNHKEQILLNVVEEMAIASGVPTPQVYLLEEQGINAFAAGSKPSNAVVGVTRGAIEQLSREELQGVIAHEFSHIFNGDMRLNMRLVGMLYGIVVIGHIGYMIMRATSRGVSYSRNGKNNTLPFVVLGLGLMLIGFAGTFCGRLIQSAVSRQREYLADASAVQYTRNPEGISAALRKIGGLSSSSYIEHSAAPELSHFFFGSITKFSLSSLFATHPPIEKRIQRLEGRIVEPIDSLTNTSGIREPNPAVSGFNENAVTVKELVSGFNAFDFEDQTSKTAALRNQLARKAIGTLPAVVVKSAHESYGARAIIYSLLLDEKKNINQKQLNILHKSIDHVLYGFVESFYQHFDKKRTGYLTALDLCIPALRELTSDQQKEFLKVCSLLIHADNRIDIFEWSLYALVKFSLEPQRFDPQNWHINSRSDIYWFRGHLAVVVSAVVHVGFFDTLDNVDTDVSFEQIEDVFYDAMSSLEIKKISVISPQNNNVDRFVRSLKRLKSLHPLQKPKLMNALAVAVASDGVIKPIEIQLLRAIAQTLDCPLPFLIKEDLENLD